MNARARWCAGLFVIGVVACRDTAVKKAVDEPALGGGSPTSIASTEVWLTAVEPKPISAAVRRGVDWLLEHQREDGGWAQGEESAHMGNGGGEARDRSNVADTCTAMLALIRSGGSAAEGPLAAALQRSAAFVCTKIEASDADSISITDVNGTRVQMKIGTHVDTFLASLALAELKGRMGDADRNERVDRALAKVIHKLEKNQEQDGGWSGSGWAPALGESIAGKGLNRAAQLGVPVSSRVLEENAKAFETAGKSAPSAAAAGIALYGQASSLSVMQDMSNTNALRERDLKKELEETKDDSRRDEIERQLGTIAEGKQAQVEAQDSVVQRLEDPSFVSGFGSNGGEEFLSYMNISESLVLRGGDAWTEWDSGVTKNLERIQNGDGSWNGHHCITGRTFCTSTALLVLLADRTPVPAELVAKAR